LQSPDEAAGGQRLPASTLLATTSRCSSSIIALYGLDLLERERGQARAA
jgi:hypothetical protein